jgi:colicin import membrane protein
MSRIGRPGMSTLVRTGGASPILDARSEPGLALAGVLAVLVHLIAIAALTYGFHIQRERTVPVIAELWSALPPAGQAEPVKPPPRPAPEPKPAPPPPPPVVKPVPKPPPEPVEKKAAAKADIELKAKLEKEKEARAAKQAEEDRRKQDEAKKREAADKQRALKEEQAKLADAERLRREQDELARKANEAAATAQAKMMASFVDKIRGKVRKFIVEPPGVPPTATAEFDVVLIPGGDVLSVKLRRSSGNALYDEAVERAIRRAEPLPIPPEPQLFPQFRELLLRFRAQE